VSELRSDSLPVFPGTGAEPLPRTGPSPTAASGPDPLMPIGGGSHSDLPTRSRGTTVYESVSRNWSGQIALGTQFTGVGGYWTVPAVTPSTSAADANWVGIGGDGITQLIQAGTTSDTSGDATTYFAWYELLPTAAIRIPDPVSPGDEMLAVIRQTSSDEWEIAIGDETKDWAVEGTVSYTAGSASSAEWISERPYDLLTRTLTTLADFGSVRFHDLRFTATDTADARQTPAYLIGTTGEIIAYPGQVGPTTTGNFTDYYGTPLPRVTSVSPSEGSTAGGTSVTITGTYLLPGLIRDVRFGSYEASGNFDTYADQGSITATAPVEPAGTVNVTITNIDGTSAISSADQYTYITPTSSSPPSSAGPPSSGYDLVGSDGGVFVFPTGSGGFYGSLPGLGVHVNDIVGMVPTANDQGYFLVGSDGGVFAFGNAPFLGSLPGLGVKPAQPITGIVPTGTDGGYFLVGRDGGVYSFGNAPFLGSLPGLGVSANNIIGITATPSGNGYWIVSATGTVYSFGAAQHLGTAKGTGSPVSAIAGTPTGGGYWIVTQNGSVYAFGNARYFNSLPGLGVSPAKPIIGIVHTADTAGYWLIGSDGGIFAFGDAPFVGSLPGLGVSVTDIVGAVPTTG
jgi:hypothetical protein